MNDIYNKVEMKLCEEKDEVERGRGYRYRGYGMNDIYIKVEMKQGEEKDEVERERCKDIGIME